MSIENVTMNPALSRAAFRFRLCTVTSAYNSGCRSRSGEGKTGLLSDSCLKQEGCNLSATTPGNISPETRTKKTSGRKKTIPVLPHSPNRGKVEASLSVVFTFKLFKNVSLCINNKMPWKIM